MQALRKALLFLRNRTAITSPNALQRHRVENTHFCYQITCFWLIRVKLKYSLSSSRLGFTNQEWFEVSDTDAAVFTD